MCSLFVKFIDCKPFIISASAFEVILIDKDLNELRILKDFMPRSTILLCSWHVLHYVDLQINKLAPLKKALLCPLVKEIV